jgi:pyruvate dehydrogenase E2 component (dihydrolipoamide acetyltransferase)
MPTTVTMPQLGETVVEGTIIKWLKTEGEEIGRDEPLFEISTDKVDTEVPSPVAGTISKILVPEGETVSVGTELAEIDDGSEGQQKAEVPSEVPEASETSEAPETSETSETEPQQDEQAGDEQDQEKEEAAPAQEQPTGQQELPADEDEDEEDAGREPGTAVDEEAEPAAQPGSGGGGNGQAAEGARFGGSGPRSRILSPLVRRLAEEHDIDLGQVSGSGTGGRITKKDILAFVETRGQQPAAASTGAAAPAVQPAQQPQPQQQQPQQQQPQAVPEREEAPAPAAARTGEREEAVPMTHIRKAIAKHMVASLQTSARAWNLVEVNMESVAQLRNRAKDEFKRREGISLTFLPFVSRAVTEALLVHPDVNAELRDDTIVRKHYVNLGIAVAYDEGLIVPVVKDADGMNVVGLARAINDVAARARTRKLKPDEVHGGTFTITNPGPFGSMISVPIINQPQTAILAFDAVEKRPVVIDDAIAIRHMVYLSMSWDHRVIDGATASQFLGRVKKSLETWDFTPELQQYL